MSLPHSMPTVVSATSLFGIKEGTLVSRVVLCVSPFPLRAAAVSAAPSVSASATATEPTLPHFRSAASVGLRTGSTDPTLALNLANLENIEVDSTASVGATFSSGTATASDFRVEDDISNKASQLDEAPLPSKGILCDVGASAGNGLALVSSLSMSCHEASPA